MTNKLPVSLDGNAELTELLDSYQHHKDMADFYQAQADDVKERIAELMPVELGRLGNWELAKVEPGQTTKWDGKYLAQLILDLTPTHPDLAERILQARSYGTRRGYFRIGSWFEKQSQE